MKKLLLIIIALLTINTLKLNAQSGIDFALSPLNFHHFWGNEEDEKNTLFQFGAKIGYFKWVNEYIMRGPSFQYNTTLNLTNTVADYNYTNNNAVISLYNVQTASYIFKYEYAYVFNAIDYKSHHFIRSSWLTGWSTKLEETLASKKIVSSSSDEFKNNKELKGNFAFPIFGFELGYGYQYNITKKLGVYADINVGMRLFESMGIMNSNVGVRYRFK